MNMKQRLFHIALGGALVLSGAALARLDRTRFTARAS